MPYKMRLRIIGFLFAALLSSCVSQLKYNRLSEEVVSLRNERESNLKRAESLKVQLEKTSKELALLKDENEALKRDSAQSGAMYRRNKILLDDVFEKYDRLNNSYNTLLSNSNSVQKDNDQEMVKMEKELLDNTKELGEVKARLMQVQSELEKKKQELESQNAVILEKENRIREIQTLTASRDKVVSGVSGKLEEVAKELSNQQILVVQKDGKIHVTLQNDSLFEGAGLKMRDSGKQVLKKLAQVLLNEEGFDIRVEGHTDIVPPAPAPAVKKKTGKGKAPVAKSAVSPVSDNWDLSAMRAVGVARELYLMGIAGSRIQAIGLSDFYPLDASNSDVARKRNRRVELIIQPRM
jgi:chemotaxis protein MotB